MYVKIPLNTITKMAIVQTNGKKTVAQVKTEQKCKYVLNLTLYNFNTFKPHCPTRIDGKTITSTSDGYWSYAFNIGSDFKMIHSSEIEKYRNVFSCSAMLKDGQNTIFKYNKDQGGVRGRTAVGLDNKGNLVLFCSKDGTSQAMSPEKLRSYMKYTLGCVSAIMMDSGQSSSCDFDGKKITTARKVANYLCVWTETEEDNKATTSTSTTKPKCPYTEPTTNIRNGSRGTGAKWVQWYLKETYDSTLIVDGIFGKNSTNALKGFQKKSSLVADGICGVLTRKALIEAYKKK